MIKMPKIIVKPVDGKPYVANIKDELSEYQQLVGGNIESFPISDNTTVLCNEEGKLRGLPYNCNIKREAFVGTIAFIGYDEDKFVDVPMSIADVEKECKDLSHKIQIYQIDMDRDKKRVKFLSHKSLPKFQGTSDIDTSLYDLVYDGKMLIKNLEEIYINLNSGVKPKGYKGHSLSVSDIVVCDGKSFYCDSFGFTSVEFDKIKEKKAEVTSEKEQEFEI